jgi:crossover junction endodeoxyribonuclease RuvC
MVRVLGIDCGSQTTGFGIVESDEQRHQLVAAGTVRLHPKQHFNQKLLKIHKEIHQLILVHCPDVVAVEDQFYLTNFKSVLKLAQVKGVVLLTAAQAGVAIAEYSPLEIKSAVTGYGRAEKSQVQAMVRKLLRLAEAPRSFDTSDALALAICHIHTSATHRRVNQAAGL